MGLFINLGIQKHCSCLERQKQSFWYLVSLETMETTSYMFCSYWNMASFILLPKTQCDIGMHDGVLPEYGYFSRSKEDITTIIY